jgi:putative ABC transport system permease protein
VKNPGFALIAILTVALGIGANTVLFSVVSGVILSPLQFANQEQLVAVYWKTPQFEQTSITFPNFLDWQKNNHTFSAMATYRGQDFSFTESCQTQWMQGQQVSAELLPVLGIALTLGRTFRTEEERMAVRQSLLLVQHFGKQSLGLRRKVSERT